MARTLQVYEPPGAPYRIVGAPDDVVAPWTSHRRRLREVLEAFEDDDWSRPTRCERWDVAALTGHLTDVTRFATTVLTSSRAGEPTRLLDGFDPAKADAHLDGRPRPEASPTALMAEFGAADDELAALIATLDHDAWEAPAEAPPGRVSARCTLNHILFDSWVHELDLLIPRGVAPHRDEAEVATTVRYVLGLCGLGIIYVGSPDTILDVRVTGPDLRVVTWVEDGWAVTEVEPATVPPGNVLVVRGDAADVVDHATGRRPATPLEGDADGAAVLGLLAAVMA